jgi:hypothetical protein
MIRQQRRGKQPNEKKMGMSRMPWPPEYFKVAPLDLQSTLAGGEGHIPSLYVRRALASYDQQRGR